MAKKLYYFDFNGVAESIRYILHYGREKFEDVRYEYKNWPMKDIKDSLPYGQLPLYEEGSRTIDQSLAIARYVANMNNLVPTDPWEQAVLDAIVYNIYDFWQKVVFYIKEKDSTKKQAIKKEILKETVDYFFSRFEKDLQRNKGFFGGKDSTKKQAIKKEILKETVDYFFSRFEKDLQRNKGFFGGKLSWADFIFVGIVEASNLFLGEEIETKYPHAVALMNKIRSLPGVREYIASRKPYTL